MRLFIMERNLMKKLYFVIAILFSVNGFAQTIEKVTEQRAREFHRVIGLNDKEQWKKFIQENYSKSMIERQMKTKTARHGEQGSSSDSKEIKGTIEDKVAMFQRLHDDFGGSKIVSIKPNGENLVMELDKGDMVGVFKLTFEKNKPYLIDRLGVEAQAGGH